MYLLIAMILLAVIFAAYLMKDPSLRKDILKWDIDSFCTIGGFLIFAGFLGLMIMLLLSLIIIHNFGKYEKVNDTNIISMKGGVGVEGDFILGSGYIKDVRYYIYRCQFSDGGIKEFNVPVNLTTIYECDGIPHYETFLQKVDTKFTYVNEQGNYLYKFYVPKGTIIKEFKVQ